MALDRVVKGIIQYNSRKREENIWAEGVDYTILASNIAKHAYKYGLKSSSVAVFVATVAISS